MFKKGDIVVCIDNGEHYGSYNPDIKRKLTIYKNYIVIDYKYFYPDNEYRNNRA